MYSLEFVIIIVQEYMCANFGDVTLIEASLQATKNPCGSGAVYTLYLYNIPYLLDELNRAEIFLRREF